jgi:GNAT superfamily N-acetyltransferase
MGKALIRLANESDLDALCDLYFEFHEFHARHVPAYLRSLGNPSKQAREELRQKIREIIQGEHSTIFVADFSGQTIGLAEIYLRQPDPTNLALVPTPYAHLQSLVVTEPLRMQGVGEQLLQAAQVWAQENGAAEMRLDIWEFAAGPLGFYEKMEYHTTRRTLAKKL